LNADYEKYVGIFFVHLTRSCMRNYRKFKIKFAGVNSEGRETNTQTHTHTHTRNEKEKGIMKTIKINKIETQEE
jgi:hypothetical protein